MTPAQLTALKTAIDAETNPTFVGFRNAGAVGQMAAWLNGDTSPAFIVWKPTVTADEISNAIDWTEYKAALQADRDVVATILNRDVVKTGMANIRAAFSAAFAAGNSRTALVALAKRTCTKAERVFATGTGTTGSPGDLGWEGKLTSGDIIDALRS